MEREDSSEATMTLNCGAGGFVVCSESNIAFPMFYKCAGQEYTEGGRRRAPAPPADKAAGRQAAGRR